MYDLFLLWSLPVAITLHNIEEAIWLPAWSRKGQGRFHPAVGDWDFRFAIVFLTAIVVAIAVMTQFRGFGSIWHYLLAAAALGQSINIIIPHLAATVIRRGYAPGLLTGILFVWPSAAWLLFESFSKYLLEPAHFLIVSAIFIPSMVAAIPVLFRIGRLLYKRDIPSVRG